MNSMNRSSQRGAVLVIALLFLTILTILGVTAMTTTTYEERLAGNTRDSGTAFQAAEAALRDARRDLNGIEIEKDKKRVPSISGKTGFGSGTADADNGTCGKQTTSPITVGLCRPKSYNATLGVPPEYNPDFFQGNADFPAVDYGKYTGAPELKGVRVQPQYYIEVLCLPQFGGSLGDPNYCNFYRITGRGWGLNPNTQVTVQEIFLKM